MDQWAYARSRKAINERRVPAGCREMKLLDLRSGVATLAAGTAIAQLITVTSMPVLTRLYTPTDFSTLAFFSSVLALLSVVVNGRLELAIPIAKTDGRALDLVWLCLLVALAVTAVFTVVILVLDLSIGLPARADQENIWLFLSLGLLLAGIYKPIHYWHIRQKNYRLITKVRIFQSSGAVATQVLIRFTIFSNIGLVFGDIFQRGAGFSGMIRHLLQHSKKINHTPTIRGIRTALRRNHRYPKYSVFEGLANSAGVNLPIILISTSTSGGEAGFFLLAFRLLAAPLNLVGGAISQVYLAEGSAALKDGLLYSSTVTAVKHLALVCILPGLLLMALAPTLTPILFGSEWGRAGEVLALMCPWFFFQLLVSPVSMAVHFIGRQKLGLILQAFGLVVRVIPVAAAVILGSDFVTEIFCGFSAIFYVFYLGSVLKTLKNEPGSAAS